MLGFFLKEFFEIIAKLQLEEIEKCLKIYEMVSLTLIQCESLILHTNSGRSSLMTHFYTSYSEKIYHALKKYETHYSHGSPIRSSIIRNV